MSSYVLSLHCFLCCWEIWYQSSITQESHHVKIPEGPSPRGRRWEKGENSTPKIDSRANRHSRKHHSEDSYETTQRQKALRVLSLHCFLCCWEIWYQSSITQESHHVKIPEGPSPRSRTSPFWLLIKKVVLGSGTLRRTKLGLLGSPKSKSQLQQQRSFKKRNQLLKDPTEPTEEIG